MAYEKQNWTAKTPITPDALNHMEEGIDTNNNNYESLLNELYYKEGDTFENKKNIVTNGFISSSATQLVFCIPVEKSLKNIKSFTVDKMIVGVRHADGGYAIQEYNELTNDGFYHDLQIATNNLIYIDFVSNKSYFTNNSTISVVIKECKITFHE